MSQSRLRRRAGPVPAGLGDRRGRKVHTQECRNCLFLKSLRDGGVPAPTIVALCERMRMQRARRGQVLYTEGNGATHLYAIRTGRVRLLRIDVHGRTRLTGVLGPGDLFGFEALFEEVHSSGAEAMSDGELCLASADQLQALMRDVPRVSSDIPPAATGRSSTTRRSAICWPTPR